MDREKALKTLWFKLARNTFALVDYDIFKIKYKPKITKEEAKKLKQACSKAIDEVLK